VRNATLFETLHLPDQVRLFGLPETLGEEGLLKVLKLEEYAPRRPLRPEMLLQVLFAYTDAVRVVMCAALLLAQVRAAVDRGRRESEQHLREVEGPREHRPVAGGEFEQPPLGTPEFAEPKVPAGDHLPNLGEQEAAGDQRLRASVNRLATFLT
jgi:hypothetical protein